MPRAPGNTNNALFLHPKNHTTPCKGCTKRNAYCHSDCEEYMEYKHNLAEAKLDREHTLRGRYGMFTRQMEKDAE